MREEAAAPHILDQVAQVVTAEEVQEELEITQLAAAQTELLELLTLEVEEDQAAEEEN